MEIIKFRPSVEFYDKVEKLKEAFRDKILVDKTVVEDTIVYVFRPKETDDVNCTNL